MAALSGLAIFLGAFLLFFVQPMIGKMILPWFGGTPAVWTTCMLFFQVLLLAGYAYAAALVRLRNPIRQVAVHLSLLAVGLFLLPITPGIQWKPPDGEQPISRILMLLVVCVGWPYFLLSATSPLMQSWFSSAFQNRSPYRLYALSNIGSLGALLAYPFLVEPAIATSSQGWLWSIGYGLFVLCCAAVGWSFALRKPQRKANETTTNLNVADVARTSKEGKQPTSKPTPVLVATSEARAITTADRLIWVLLPALASTMMLAITNYLCQDVAVVPFLWILPLSLYLISLIICFDRDWWYAPRWFSLGAIVGIILACDLDFLGYLAQIGSIPSTSKLNWFRLDIWVISAVYLWLFFFVCMVCHGEVVRRKPPAQQLTSFYLYVSAGGALGGVLVAIVFPNIFRSFLELKYGLVICFMVSILVLLRDAFHITLFDSQAPAPSISPTVIDSTTAASERTKKNVRLDKRKGVETTTQKPASSTSLMQTIRASRFLRGFACVVAFVLVLVVATAQWLSIDKRLAQFKFRNFYGALTIREWFTDDPEQHGRALYHGSILHGYQLVEEPNRRKPTTYYSESGGAGKAMLSLQERGPLRVGVVGLGIGTMAAYGRAGDVFRFYEINPLVIQLAKEQFTFLSDSPATIEIAAGDARLSMEREEPQQFDLLVLDAFSGDSIPVHLLTREAMQIYLHHMKPTGIIAIHVSNRYVDLDRVVLRLAANDSLFVSQITKDDGVFLVETASDWMLLSKSADILTHPNLAHHVSIPTADTSFPIWTDDYNNLFGVLHKSRW